jgi:simple sugar transport system ATP-binding protein
VLRDGKNGVSLSRKDASDDMLIRAMVGEGMDLNKSVIFSQDKTHTSKKNQKVVLSLTGVNKISAEKTLELSDVTFSIHSGEIFGIAGVAGIWDSENWLKW